MCVINCFVPLNTSLSIGSSQRLHGDSRIEIKVCVFVYVSEHTLLHTYIAPCILCNILCIYNIIDLY